MTPDLLDLMGDRGRLPKDEPQPVPSLKTEHCELELVLLYENEVKGEILVSASGRESEGCWLKTAQVQFTRTGRTAAAVTASGKAMAQPQPVIAVNIPEWLAKEKGLI